MGTKTILILIVAFFYKQRVSDERKGNTPKPLMESPPHDFHFGVCDCFADLSTCLFACCFFPIRVADTLSAANITVTLPLKSTDILVTFWQVIGGLLALDLFTAVASLADLPVLGPSSL